VVDLDGTLTATDTLVESLIQVVKKNPLDLLRVPFWLLQGRAAFKRKVAAHASVNAAYLPLRQPLLDYLVAEKEGGRRIVLATAAHRSIAQGVVDRLPVFDQLLCTDGDENLKGEAKLKAIQQHVAPDFVYAGDSSADLPIWRAAQAAVLVGVSSKVAREVKQHTPVEREFFNDTPGVKLWAKALRVHQWIKNLLLFVPLLTAFSFSELGNVVECIMAFIAFSIAASATYIVNDLWDIESDRQHPRKRLRPFASARIPIATGVLMAAALLVGAFVIAAFLPKAFLLLLALYVVMTTTYSIVLKSYVLIDVLMLSLLYTLRILAGAAAIGIVVSSWLLAFSMFVFLSLALVKRCSELVSLAASGKDATRGRDYRVADLAVLWPMGVSATISSLVVFGLFISSEETQTRYLSPAILWITTLLLSYWLGRLWIKTARSEMHDDPVVYAVVNRGSRITVAAIVCTMLLARFLPLERFL
jgi:4-hydroxybenzoate polyprenyltransferase/phosphoglycolate phosphatase-like HAD superfamily hydrolase